MCIRDRKEAIRELEFETNLAHEKIKQLYAWIIALISFILPVSYTHLRAHETVLDIVCRLMLEKKKKTQRISTSNDA